MSLRKNNFYIFFIKIMNTQLEKFDTTQLSAFTERVCGISLKGASRQQYVKAIMAYAKANSHQCHKVNKFIRIVMQKMQAMDKPVLTDKLTPDVKGKYDEDKDSVMTTVVATESVALDFDTRVISQLRFFCSFFGLQHDKNSVQDMVSKLIDVVMKDVSKK